MKVKMANELKYADGHRVYHIYYANGVLGSFFRGLASYFATELYPRTKEVVIGTYQKAIQHYTNLQNEAGEKYTPEFPFLTFDPTMEFEPEEVAGKFLYQYPNFLPGFAAKVFSPTIYEDANISIDPVLNRYKGRCELIIWCSSVYELIDLRVLTYQFFGGNVGRLVKPKSCQSYFIMPNELVFYSHTNPYQKTTYPLDWENNQRVDINLIKNINQNRMVFPFLLEPSLKLEGISDASTKYGGDTLSEEKLSLDISWECYIPTHLVLSVHNQSTSHRCCRFSMQVGKTYTGTLPRIAYMTDPGDSPYDIDNPRFDPTDPNSPNSPENPSNPNYPRYDPNNPCNPCSSIYDPNDIMCYTSPDNPMYDPDNPRYDPTAPNSPNNPETPWNPRNPNYSDLDRESDDALKLSLYSGGSTEIPEYLFATCIIGDNTSTINIANLDDSGKHDYEVSNSYNYILSTTEIASLDAGNNIIIPLLEIAEDLWLDVYATTIGSLIVGYQWKINDDNMSITLYGADLRNVFEDKDHIDIVYYKPIDQTPK